MTSEELTFAHGLRRLRKLARRGVDLETVVIPQLDPPDGHDHYLPGTVSGMAIARKASSQFEALFTDGLSCFPLGKKECQTLDAARGRRGYPERLVLSCAPLRLHATKTLIERWALDWKQHRKQGRRYFFITLLDDCGNVLDREPHIYLEPLRRKTDKVLRQVGLDGMILIEVQALTNFPGNGDGRTLMFHSHVIATIDDANLEAGAIEAEMLASKRLSTFFGAPTVTVKELRTLGALQRTCAYALEAPAIGKRLIPHPDIPGASTFTPVFVRKDQACRLGELLMQLEINQVVHSVGAAKHIVRPWLSELRQWHRKRYLSASRKLPADVGIARMWADIRCSRAGNRYQPVVFESGRLPPRTCWSEAAQRARAIKRMKRK